VIQYDVSASYTVQIHRLQCSHAVLWVHSWCIVHKMISPSSMQSGHLTSLVLLVTLLSYINTAAGNSFKILFLGIFAKILSIYRQKSVLYAINTFSYQLTELTILRWPTLWDSQGFSKDNSALKYQFLNRESYWILMVLLSQPHCTQANGNTEKVFYYSYAVNFPPFSTLYR